MIDYGSIYNMTLISFITGFAGVGVYQKKHKQINLKNKIIGGCIVGSICTIAYALLIKFN